ncbi:MAG: HNH endonuclease signature motif containing protein [Candidatus Competibacteraceae bacterium]
MDDVLRLLVRERARHSCEYCRLAAHDAPFLAFHLDHIIARQHGGTDDPDNLALACLWCNLHKGPNLSGIDPETGQITALFHPRQWSAHFALRGVHIIGRTPNGCATVQVLV